MSKPLNREGSKMRNKGICFVQGVINDREHRITELEEALRESIRITAQREVVMHEQQMKLEHTERVVSFITCNTEQT